MAVLVAQRNTNRITGGRRWWALVAVLLTMFFASLDQTVVSTAMPVIIGDLQGFNLYAWVFTAYLIASAVTVPIYGKLSDIGLLLSVGMFGTLLFLPLYVQGVLGLSAQTQAAIRSQFDAFGGHFFLPEIPLRHNEFYEEAEEEQREEAA